MQEPRLELYQDIAAPQSATWEACACAEGLGRWQADVAHGEARIGGRLRLAWPALGQEVELEVIEAVFGERLVYRAGDSVTEFGFGPGGVRLRHSGPDVALDRAGVEASWRLALAELAFSLECHPGRARRVRWALRALQVTPERAFSLFTEPDYLNQWLTRHATLGAAQEPYAFTLRSGLTLSGRVLVAVPGRDVGLTVDSHAGALLKLRTLPAPPELGRWLCLSWARWGRELAEDALICAELERALDALTYEIERGPRHSGITLH